MVNSSRDHGKLAIGEGSMADWVEVILHHQTQQLGRKMKRVEKSTQQKIKTSREVAFLIQVGSRVVVAAMCGGCVEFGPFMVLCCAVCLDLGWSPDLWIQIVSLVWALERVPNKSVPGPMGLSYSLQYSRLPIFSSKCGFPLRSVKQMRLHQQYRRPRTYRKGIRCFSVMLYRMTPITRLTLLKN